MDPSISARTAGKEKAMKPIKMLGLTALAALMAMAFVGASSAMAETTALCKKDENPCSGGNLIMHVHETTLSRAILLGSPKVECSVLFLGVTASSYVEIEGVLIYQSQTLANPLQIVGKFTYTQCTNFCTVKEEGALLATIKVLKTGSELAAVTGESLINLSCPFGIECFYNGEGLEGHALGALTSGGTGAVTLSEQETTKESGSGICPEEGFLDITTHPSELTYISS
jgi:hypothetical protein